jgi:hypothetical protein
MVMNRTTKLLLLILILTLSTGLVMYSIKGFSTRYAQDDYCYGYHLNENGFFRNQWLSYSENTEYNGNRYSLTFSINVVELLGGPNIVAVLPMLLICLWASALSLLVMIILNYTNKQNYVLLSICIGIMVTFFSIYLSPQQYQVFFWLSGQQPYFMPLVIYTIISVLFLSILKLEDIKIIHVVIIGILTFLAGGYSETSTLWFVVLSGFLNAYVLLFGEDNLISSKARVVLFVIFLVTLVSAILLAVSPYNAVSSRSTMSPILPALYYSFIYAADFIVDMLKIAPIPYSILVVFGFLIAHLITPLNQTNNIKIGKFFIIASVLLYTLCASSIFPTVYAMSVYPGPRALTPAHLSLLAFLILFGWLLERLQRNILPTLSNKTSLSFVTSILIIIILSVYVGRAIFLESQKIYDHHNRAIMWDLRHEMILHAKISGMQNVVVPAFDSIFMITELNEDPGHWVNRCAAQYYGVSSITAIENHNGIGTYPLGK